MLKYIILALLLITTTASAEMDCLDYALESGEPVILVGTHPYFYFGTMLNHYYNYEIIDKETIILIDYNISKSVVVSTRCWEEIRPGVYYNGMEYFKMFIYREPQRYWGKMI